MIWPEFNELGDLPVGVHRAEMSDVLAHFGHGATQRKTVTARLERIYELVRSTGCLQRFIIFGSYITAESHPHDVDVFLVMQGSFQPHEAPLKHRPCLGTVRLRASLVRVFFGSTLGQVLPTQKI